MESTTVYIWFPWNSSAWNAATDQRCKNCVRLNDGPDIKLFILVGWGRSFFVCLLLGPSGFICWFFYCSSVSAVLFDNPGISRCRSQHVSFESSSLFHHSIYLRFICFLWWSIDELENLHADRTTVCLEPWQKPRARLSTHKTGLSHPVIFTDRSKAALLLWFIFICYHICSFACCMTLWPL